MPRQVPEPAPEPIPDPAAAYSTPEELAADESLALEERIRLLERWEADDAALLRAEGEGMGGGERPRLGRVQRLLACLRQGEAPPSDE